MSDPKIIEMGPPRGSRAQRGNDINAAALAIAHGPTEVVQVQKYDQEDPGTVQSPQEDVFANLLNGNQIIEPPFDLLGLSVQTEQSSELGQVVDAMEINIDGFGHQIKPLMNKALLSVEQVRLLDEERLEIDDFFEYCNLRDSFTDLRRKTRHERELTGNAYWEVIRNASGKISGFELVPSFTVRLSPRDKVPTRTEVPKLKKQLDGTYQITTMIVNERFRKYAVSSAIALRANFHSATASSMGVRWFKEFGDTRVIDGETGQVVPDDKVANFDGTGRPMPADRRANELIHFAIYSARSPYGVPHYIGNLLSIVGDRMAEETNYITFENNQIPSAFLLCSGGQVTGDSIKRIKEFMESQHQGKRNYARMVLIEAEGLNEGDDASAAKLELKPATQAQHKDALFQEYSKGNQDKIRRAYRIAPMFVGRSDEASRAMADAARRLCDEQVFAPERSAFDSFINRRLFPAMGVRFHRYQSNSPNTTDNGQIVTMLATAERTGGMTPRIARTSMEEVLGRELPPFPLDAAFNPDLPFSLAMAEAVKNKAIPSEVGQQVTALKAFGVLGDDHAISEMEKAADDLETGASLLRTKARLDKAFANLEDAHK